MENVTKLRMYLLGIICGVCIPSVIRGNYGYPLGILILTLIVVILNFKSED